MKSKNRNDSKYRTISMPLHRQLFIVAVLIIIAFLLLIVPVLNWLSSYADTPFGHWFSPKNGVSDWFAFWGSFSGAIASVLVGIATIRLTEFQLQMSVATGMPQVTGGEMRIYSVSRSQIKADYLSKFPHIDNYCMVLRLDMCFPPYFDILIDSIQLSAKGPLHEASVTETALLDKAKNYCFSNNESFELYINVPTTLDSMAEHFFFLNLETTNATPYENKSIEITLRFKCSNALLHASVFNRGEVNFDMVLTMESEGKCKDCVKFKANDIKFVRAERRRLGRCQK